MEQKIKVAKIKSGGKLKEEIAKAVDVLGGFPAFIKKGDVVFLKPNFNTADPFPASTDLPFLKAAVELLYEAGAKLVMIGESSTYTLNTRKILEQRGVFGLQESENPPRVYVLDELEWARKEIPQGKYLKAASIPKLLEKADKLVYLPCLKTHSQGRFTASLKLSVGLMKPLERVRLHLRRLEEKIAELNVLMKPDLIIMDARKVFVTDGPSEGRVEEPNFILASTDRVAIDVEGVKILQSYGAKNHLNMPIWDLPTIKRAAGLGFGARSEEEYEVIED